ncbi:hypothetical protein JCM5350_006852 [Sporobolomyces pararoseus]
MSFTNLPPELQEAIICSLYPRDLSRLCLVSKSLLHLCRPFLYRSLSLDFELWESRKEDSEDEIAINSMEADEAKEWMQDARRWWEREQSRQLALSRVFKAHPEWVRYVRELEVTVDRNLGGGPADRLLPTLPNLETLTVKHYRPGTLDEENRRALILDIPSTVTHLDLIEAPFQDEDLPLLLSKLPNLRTFACKLEEEINIADVLKLPPLDKLQSLQFRNCPLDRPSFSTFISSSRLTSLDIDFRSIPSFSLDTLSNLKELSLSASTCPLRRERPSTFVAQLVDFLRGCRALVSLEIHSCDYEESHAMFREFERAKILHQIPSIPRRLVLCSFGLNTSYLYDYLSTIPSHHLHLTLSYLVKKGEQESGLDENRYKPLERDEEAKGKMEQFCEKGNIALEWVNDVPG